MIKLFSLSGKELQLEYQELLLYPEFEAIIKRDKSPDKVTAYQEMKFIYFYCDVNSTIVQRFSNDKERLKEAKLISRFPLLWQPDDLIQQAIYRYKQEQVTPSLHLLEEIRKTVNTSTKFVSFMNDNIEVNLSKLQELSDKITETVATVDEATQFSNSLKTIFDFIVKTQELSVKLPSLLDKIDDLTLKVKSQISEKKLAAGKRSLGNREDTDYLGRMDSKPIEIGTPIIPTLPVEEKTPEKKEGKLFQIRDPKDKNKR